MLTIIKTVAKIIMREIPDPKIFQYLINMHFASKYEDFNLFIVNYLML